MRLLTILYQILINTTDLGNSTGSLKIKNPVHDFIELGDDVNMNDLESISLFDLTGRLTASFQTVEKQLQVTGLKSGIYFLQVKTSNGKLFIQKIIISH